MLVVLLLMFSVENSAYIVYSHYGTRLTALAIGDIALVIVLQLYHSGAARKGRRPRVWPLTLALQALLVYAFLFPFVWAYVGALGPFLAGSVLLLVPGRWRWAGYAALVASYAVLYSVLPLRGEPDPGGAANSERALRRGGHRRSRPDGVRAVPAGRPDPRTGGAA